MSGVSDGSGSGVSENPTGSIRGHLPVSGVEVQRGHTPLPRDTRCFDVTKKVESRTK